MLVFANAYPAVVTLFRNDLDSNVLHSKDIDADMVCTLISSGSQTCGPPYQAQVVQASMAHSQIAPDDEAQQSQETPANSQRPEAQRVIPRMDNRRIAVQAPQTKLKLAEAVEIPITLNEPGLTKVHTVQCVPSTETRECSARLSDTVQIVPVLTRPDGTRFIRVVPMQLGHVGLIVTGQYHNQVFSEARVQIDVEPSSKKPQQLLVGRGGGGTGNVGTLSLNMERNAKLDVEYIDPQAVYANLLTPIDVRGHATMTVKATPGDPVLRVDSANGMVLPLRPGHALLRTTFAGATNLTCVIVTERALDHVRNERCADLLEPNETLSR